MSSLTQYDTYQKMVAGHTCGIQKLFIQKFCKIYPLPLPYEIMEMIAYKCAPKYHINTIEKLCRWDAQHDVIVEWLMLCIQKRAVCQLNESGTSIGFGIYRGDRIDIRFKMTSYGVYSF